MSNESTTVGLEQVIADEQQEIQKRRERIQRKLDEYLERDAEVAKAGTNKSPADDLVGVALSGGGLRAASFGLGVVQSFHKSGLWRFVDYLSTVSGGGYLGGVLSTLVVKQRQVFHPQNCPLLPLGDGPQPAIVQQQIFGGNRLLKSWELVNRYLIGVVLINLTIFSAIIALSAAIAFVWRCFDYPAFRDRAGLLDLNSDLLSPFFPAILFAGCWLAAWMISLWRSGALAPGRYARRFLFLMLGSVLIGIALLLGNGDISVSGLDGIFGRKPTKVSGNWGASLIGLIMGGLLPFLNPKRLIESGLKKEKSWVEKYVFAMASVAMLIGLPLVFVGFFAQENISGFNTHPHREIVRGDITNWPGLTAVILPYKGENLDEKQKATVDKLRKAFARIESPLGKAMGTKDAPSGSKQDPVADNAVHPVITNLEGIQVLADLEGTEFRGKRIRWWRQNRLHVVLNNVDFATIDHPNIPVPGQLDETTKYEASEKAIGEIQNDPLGAKTPWVAHLYNNFPFRHLCCLALALDKATQDERYDEAEMHDLGSWEHDLVPALTQRLRQFWRTCGWELSLSKNDTDEENYVVSYWKEKAIKERLQDEICTILNQSVLNGSVLLEQLASQPNAAAKDRSPRFQSLVARAHETEAATWLPFERRELNRYLLEESLYNIFQARTNIRRLVCISEDQQARLRYAGFAGLVFLFLGLVVNVNTTSMHRYYRNRLERAFLLQPNSSARNWALSDLRTTSYGAPYHLICASVGLLNKIKPNEDGGASALDESPNAASVKQRIVPFVMSQRYCGSELTEYVSTERYEGRRVDLADAIALSGSAVSPSQIHNPLIAFLMFTLNLRLGQWLPNPRRQRPRWWPTLLALAYNLRRKPEDRDHLFVTDGGYSDNTGLLPLLDRRCALIFVVDASHDPNHEFGDLARAIRTARVHDGIRFLELGESVTAETDAEIDLHAAPLQLARSGNGDAASCKQHFVLARIKYPKRISEEKAKEGLLVYLKPSFTGDESLDLLQYRAKSKDFPQESSNDQLFDEDQVESYRQLGYHIGAQVCQSFPPVREGQDLWSAAADQRINVERLRDWLTGKEGRRATTQEPPQDVAVAGHFQTVSEDIGSCDATAVAQRRETEFGVVATIVAGVATNNAVATVEVDPQVKKSITGNQRSNSKKLRREKPR